VREHGGEFLEWARGLIVKYRRQARHGTGVENETKSEESARRTP
jgi:hypothetical protein